MSVDANFEDFRTAVADLIVALAPMPSASKNLTISHQQIQNKIPGCRIRLRSQSVSVPSKKSRTVQDQVQAGKARQAKKKLCWQDCSE